jgi:hypothetical protein
LRSGSSLARAAEFRGVVGSVGDQREALATIGLAQSLVEADEGFGGRLLFAPISMLPENVSSR